VRNLKIEISEESNSNESDIPVMP